jgi:hypothetical protein
MDYYDSEKSIDSNAWLLLDEGERIRLAMETHDVNTDLLDQSHITCVYPCRS